MARAQTMKKEPWRKYKTNTYINVYNFLKINGHTETPLVMVSNLTSKYLRIVPNSTAAYHGLKASDTHVRARPTTSAGPGVEQSIQIRDVAHFCRCKKIKKNKN